MYFGIVNLDDVHDLFLIGLIMMDFFFFFSIFYFFLVIHYFVKETVQ